MSGVQVLIINQQTGFQSGGITQSNGRFLVVGLRAGGPFRIEARMLGYGLQALDNVVLEAGGTFEANFTLGTEVIVFDVLEVFSTRAIERKTPVAYTDVPKVQIVNQLGSRDLPMILNVTPSAVNLATPSIGGTMNIISDATDNSSYNGFDDDHDADDAEAYLGQPRMFNLGFEIKF